ACLSKASAPSNSRSLMTSISRSASGDFFRAPAPPGFRSISIVRGVLLSSGVLFAACNLPTGFERIFAMLYAPADLFEMIRKMRAPQVKHHTFFVRDVPGYPALQLLELGLELRRAGLKMQQFG